MAFYGILQLTNLSSDPGGAAAGQMYFNTSLGKVRYYNGSSWITID